MEKFPSPEDLGFYNKEKDRIQNAEGAADMIIPKLVEKMGAKVGPKYNVSQEGVDKDVVEILSKRIRAAGWDIECTFIPDPMDPDDLKGEVTFNIKTPSHEEFKSRMRTFAREKKARELADRLIEFFSKE